MYQTGEYVLYGIHGVCRACGTERRLVDRRFQEYLVLEPLSSAGSRYYLPLANPAAMGKLRPVLTAEKLKELLESDCIRVDCWIAEENARKQRYRDLVGSCDRTALLQMVCSAYRFRTEQSANGRKFHQCDENFLKDAEKILSSEISVILNISQEEARNYLRSCLQSA